MMMMIWHECKMGTAEGRPFGGDEYDWSTLYVWKIVQRDSLKTKGSMGRGIK
jgi:hypothetical protein